MKAQAKQVDRSPERISQMFNEIAPKYDLLNDLLSVGLARGWRRRLVKEVFSRLATQNETSAKRIETLDVATGTGDVVIEERRQWERRARRDQTNGAELTTIGADFSSEMLELARKKAPSVEFVEADGLALPFESNRFDAATISFGLRNMSDPKRGIAEMARVCRPGGVIAILEFAPPKTPIFAPIFRAYFHCVLPFIGQRVAKNQTEAYKYLPESVDAFDSPERILEYMRDAGIKDAQWFPMTFGVLGLFIGTKEKGDKPEQAK